MLRLLFVCTGNICRSPIAHGLMAARAARLGPDAIEVRSAGTWGRNGSRATREAVLVASSHGIDIRAHRASRFTSELATWADLIVTMTEEQGEELRAEAPEADPKAFTLKQLVALLRELPPPPSGPISRDGLLVRIQEADSLRRSGKFAPPMDLDVSDPLGLSEIVYRAVAHELSGLVEELLAGLAGQNDEPRTSDRSG